MKASKTGLFLMELIISILFFSIAAAVCVQLFVKAHLLNQKTELQNQIVVYTQNLSEIWNSLDGDMPAVYDELSKDYIVYYSEEQNEITIYLNSKLVPCYENAESYIITLSSLDFDEENHCYQAFISVSSKEEDIYSIPLTHHKSLTPEDL